MAFSTEPHFIASQGDNNALYQIAHFIIELIEDDEIYKRITNKKDPAYKAYNELLKSFNAYYGLKLQWDDFKNLFEAYIDPRVREAILGPFLRYYAGKSSDFVGKLDMIDLIIFAEKLHIHLYLSDNQVFENKLIANKIGLLKMEKVGDQWLRQASSEDKANEHNNNYSDKTAILPQNLKKESIAQAIRDTLKGTSLTLTAADGNPSIKVPPVTLPIALKNFSGESSFLNKKWQYKKFIDEPKTASDDSIFFELKKTPLVGKDSHPIYVGIKTVSCKKLEAFKETIEVFQGLKKQNLYGVQTKGVAIDICLPNLEKDTIKRHLAALSNANLHIEQLTLTSGSETQKYSGQDEIFNLFKSVDLNYKKREADNSSKAPKTIPAPATMKITMNEGGIEDKGNEQDEQSLKRRKGVNAEQEPEQEPVEENPVPGRRNSLSSS